MRGLSSGQPSSSGSEGAPYRHLAVRVIDQAFRDLANPIGSIADQESARVFLAGSSMFYHWCEVADLDPAWMVARARKLMADNWSSRSVHELQSPHGS
jgi:hypothetical protein